MLRNLARRLFTRPNRHHHDWDYGPRSIGGWGIVRCRTCGAEDLY